MNDGSIDFQGLGASGLTFSTFGSPIINTNDRVAYAATLATTTNNTGIWADDSAGNPQLVARAGDLASTTIGTAAFVTFTAPSIITTRKSRSAPR